MEDQPADLTEGTLLNGLHRFGVVPQSTTYAPVGFGDYHWFVTAADGARWFATVADLDHKGHCGSDAEAALIGLRRAMLTALALREDGLGFVVAPIRAEDGDPVLSLDSRYALSVFPVVEGTPGHFGQQLNTAELELVQRMLAELHVSAPPGDVPVAPLDPPGRAELEAVLDGPLGEWDGGPHGPGARDLVAEHADVLRARFADFDWLAEEVRRRDAPVVTHGEPHPGNLIRTGTGYQLVDWDTAGLAVPERDLSLLSDDPAALTCYRDLTGHTPSADALALYRLRWSLVDVAEFVEWFRAPHTRTPDTDSAWRAFTGTVEALAKG